MQGKNQEVVVIYCKIINKISEGFQNRVLKAFNFGEERFNSQCSTLQKNTLSDI